MRDDDVEDMRVVPGNFGPLRGADGSARITGPCGDTMEVWLKIVRGKVARATFTSDGCGHSLLCGSAAARLAEEMDVPFLGRIPFNPAIGTACDAGTPATGAVSAASQAFACVTQPILALGGPSSKLRSSSTTKEITMRFALPLADGKLAMHFGHCERFALIDADNATKKIVKRDEIEAPEHQPGLLPPWLAERGVNIVIAGGMGGRARDLFATHKIKVVVGAPAEKPDKLVLDYLAGSLVTGDNACDH